MSLNINAYGAENIAKTAEQNVGRAEAKRVKQSIYAGNSNIADNPIAQKRKEAQEAAWNVVKKAWDSDMAVDKMIQSRREHYAELNALKERATAELSDIADEKEALRELYDVDAASEEQKDLELLEKAKEIHSGVRADDLTDEERKRIGELYQSERTEYQSRVLGIHDRAVELKKQIEDADKQMRHDVAAVKAIGLERLKENPMLDATKAAEDIMEASNQAIIGMAVQEAKENIEEKLEEAKENAEEKAEEKEKREEQLEEQKLNRAIQEAMIEGTKEAVEKAKAIERQMEAPDIDTAEMTAIVQNDAAGNDVAKNLDDIKYSMKLLEADLKGIKVDEEV